VTGLHALHTTAVAWLAAGRAAVVVEVLSSRGSVPREAGTRMLVAAHEVLGSIGGGHLELQAISDARAFLRRGAVQAFEQPIALGPTLGQCCGGSLTLRFAALQGSAPQTWATPPPLFTLQLYGAGHVGRAVVALLAQVSCQVCWIDEREDEFPAGPLPPHIQRLCVEPVQAEVHHAAPGAFYLVLTHSHDLDLAIAQAVLQRADFGYFGLIGSKTKRARFEHRLLARGVHSDTLARMVCPIGIAGITGKEPEVIALAVVAQLLQVASTGPQADR
jgi:xanthine dehydrogenase accessory factor